MNLSVAQPVKPITTPDEASRAMASLLTPVGVETVPLGAAAGRVLAQGVVADRPSPPSDVSSMDGYAVRLADAARGRVPVIGGVLPGRPAPPLTHGAAVRIMTGAVVPDGAEAVIRREDVDESEDAIVIHEGVSLNPGQNIRHRGENLPVGAAVVSAGVSIDPAIATALSTFGVSVVRVYRRVRVAVIVTGDELLPPEAHAEPWQIRDSNGPALEALLATCPWVEFLGRTHVTDEYEALRATVREQLDCCDALFVTGGVSAGTHDFVPAALRDAGCEVVFHKLPLRPGHPVLGARGPGGQAVMGLPGNPLSVMTTARRIGAPALRGRAGFAETVERRPAVTLDHHDGRTLHLWWYRPVRLIGGGLAELVESKGSGDLVSAARSDGFVEVPPHETGVGPWPFYTWAL